MGYPEKVLAEQETVAEHLHPHWITLVPATLWFLVICAGAGFGIAFLPSGHTAHLSLLVAIIVAGLVLLLWLSFTPWAAWRTTHYVFTTHRVLIRQGVLRHVGRDIALQRINDVAYAQTLRDRIVGAGTLTIESAGEHGQEVLSNIPHSDRVQQLLNRLIEQDGERRARLAAGGYPAPNPSEPAQYPPPQYPPAQYPPPQYPPAQYPPPH